MLTYTLSNRQRKELLVRGRPLQIAIPLGPDDVDPIGWARASLPEDEEWIESAECAEIIACASGTSGLNGMLGEIQDDYATALRKRLPPMCISVVIATLVPPSIRNGTMQIQWPGRAWIDGEEIGRGNEQQG